MATGTTGSNCPREAASGKLTEEFGTNNAGAKEAMKWLQKTRKWIEDTFKDWCAYDADCPKTQLVITASSAMNPETKKMAYTLSFIVVCYCTTEITPAPKKRQR